ncbi:HP1 family phage holin [Azospirillum argentinense]
MFDRPTNPTTLSYASSLGTVVFSLNVNELVALGGLVLALLTFVINWRYKHLHYRLAATKTVAKEAPDVAEG